MTSQGIVDLRSKKSGGHIRRWPNPLSQREKPRSPLRAKRRRVRALMAFAILAALGVAAFGVSWLSYNPRLMVNEIVVSGAEATRPELVRTYVETQLYSGGHSFLSRSNIFLYPRADLERALAQFFPRIKSATVSRAGLLAQAITVQVKERESFAQWCSSGADTCYALDSDGFVFAAGTTTDRFLPPYIFSGGIEGASPLGKTYMHGRLSGVLALLEKLSQAGFLPQTIVAENEQDFSVRLKGEFLLRLSYGGDINGVIRNLELVLGSDGLVGKRSRIEYIDLRFGNRVYYKLKGATAEGKVESE